MPISSLVRRSLIYLQSMPWASNFHNLRIVSGSCHFWQLHAGASHDICQLPRASCILDFCFKTGSWKTSHNHRWLWMTAVLSLCVMPNTLRWLYWRVTDVWLILLSSQGFTHYDPSLTGLLLVVEYFYLAAQFISNYFAKLFRDLVCIYLADVAALLSALFGGCL